MRKKEALAIEAAVNSQEVVDLVDKNFSNNWDKIIEIFERGIGRSLTKSEKSSLDSDLYDWFKNGNFRVWGENEVADFRVWGENEVNDFDMTKWELGDPDFWPPSTLRQN